MRSMRSAQRQVELRLLGNQLTVLGKANSPCKIVKLVCVLQIESNSHFLRFFGFVPLFRSLTLTPMIVIITRRVPVQRAVERDEIPYPLGLMFDPNNLLTLTIATQLTLTLPLNRNLPN